MSSGDDVGLDSGPCIHTLSPTLTNSSSADFIKRATTSSLRSVSVLQREFFVHTISARTAKEISVCSSVCPLGGSPSKRKVEMMLTTSAISDCVNKE